MTIMRMLPAIKTRKFETFCLRDTMGTGAGFCIGVSRFFWGFFVVIVCSARLIM